jgi:hypothetical protein
MAASALEIPEDATPEVSANALLNILERVLHASKSEWLFLRELRVGTGFRNSSSQRLDAFALNCLPHTAMRRVCYEVKISRADFLCELRHPLKRRIGMRFSNEFFFITPPGLLKTSEIPVECGLIEIDPTRQDYCTVAVPAPWRDTPGPTWQFAAAMLRNQRRQWEDPPPAVANQGRLTFE